MRHCTACVLSALYACIACRGPATPFLCSYGIFNLVFDSVMSSLASISIAMYSIDYGRCRLRRAYKYSCMLAPLQWFVSTGSF